MVLRAKFGPWAALREPLQYISHMHYVVNMPSKKIKVFYKNLYIGQRPRANLALLISIWRAMLHGTAGHLWPAGHVLRITSVY